MKHLLGFDIGGTKCAVIYATAQTDTALPQIIQKLTFPTCSYPSAQEVIHHMLELANQLIQEHGPVVSAGISCGGPLDSKNGIILSPPNLPKWDRIPITKMISAQLQIPVFLQNDANACALAEWKFGNGIGTDHFIFFTFGTGLGAGLILNRQLLAGNCDNAGEAGHWRMHTFGPVGYGKAGSLEGFASGGGIAQLAKTKLEELAQAGMTHSLATHPDGITAKTVFALAQSGDALCQEIVQIVGTKFGQALALMIDLLNPDVIVAGSIFTRNYDLLYPIVRQVVDREALPTSAAHCKILPSKLEEQIGDYAALTVALNH